MSKKPELKWLDDNLVEVRNANGRTSARLIAAHRTRRLVKSVMQVSGSTYQVTLEPGEPTPRPGDPGWPGW